MLINHNKYYYLVVGTILRLYSNIHHFIWYHGVYQTLHLITGKKIFEPVPTFKNKADYEYLFTYKAMKDNSDGSELSRLSTLDE